VVCGVGLLSCGARSSARTVGELLAASRIVQPSIFMTRSRRSAAAFAEAVVDVLVRVDVEARAVLAAWMGKADELPGSFPEARPEVRSAPDVANRHWRFNSVKSIHRVARGSSFRLVGCGTEKSEKERVSSYFAPSQTGRNVKTRGSVCLRTGELLSKVEGLDHTRQ